jgi:hypothetical protein
MRRELERQRHQEQVRDYNDSCGEVAVLKEQNRTRNQNEIFETKGARKYI